MSVCVCVLGWRPDAEALGPKTQHAHPTRQGTQHRPGGVGVHRPQVGVQGQVAPVEPPFGHLEAKFKVVYEAQSCRATPQMGVGMRSKLTSKVARGHCSTLSKYCLLRVATQMERLWAPRLSLLTQVAKAHNIGILALGYITRKLGFMAKSHPLNPVSATWRPNLR